MSSTISPTIKNRFCQFKDIVYRRLHLAAQTIVLPTINQLKREIEHGYCSSVFGVLFAEGIELQKHLGTGGMGTTFLGIDANGNKIAVKVFWAENAQGFENEVKMAKAALMADYLHMTRFSSQGDGPVIMGHATKYIAFEYSKGIPLHEKLKSGPIPVRDSLEILHQLCYSFANTKIVHRDIKPENIILWEDFYAEAIDVGIAVPKSRWTQFFSLKPQAATYLYAAPEQCVKRKWFFERFFHYDTRTDIYMLGNLLHTLLMGEFFYNDETGQSAAILNGDVRQQYIDAKRRGLPRIGDVAPLIDVQILLDWMIAFNREERPSDCSVLMSEIARILNDIDDLQSRH